uniref:Macrophage erythroblast attacher-like n=1 Tax=Rhizophora mucronata TaxID=61149 RepID=A0A2P2JLS5_RHIMU
MNSSESWQHWLLKLPLNVQHTRSCLSLSSGTIWWISLSRSSANYMA